MGEAAGSIIGAGASIFGSMQQSSAAKKAASAQLQSTAMSIQAQQAAQAEQRNYLMPYISAGNNSLPYLNNPDILHDYIRGPQNNPDLYGNVALPTVPTAMSQRTITDADRNLLPQGIDQQTLERTPGYQFNLSQGLRAAQTGAAARGLGLSGAGVKAASRYATGLADSTYQNQWNNLLQKSNFDLGVKGQAFGQDQALFGQGQALFGNQMTRFGADLGQRQQQFANQQQLFGNAQSNQTNGWNRLMGLYQGAQNSAAGVGSGALTTGANIGSSWTSAGNALAASQLAQGRALSSGLSNVGTYASQGLRSSSNPFASLFGGGDQWSGGQYGISDGRGFDFDNFTGTGSWS